MFPHHAKFMHFLKNIMPTPAKCVYLAAVRHLPYPDHPRAVLANLFRSDRFDLVFYINYAFLYLVSVDYSVLKLCGKVMAL